jgi:hypothetical protein
MALSREELAADIVWLLPTLRVYVREVRSQAVGASDPRGAVKLQFGDAATRPALLARLGLNEGALNEGEFYQAVDVAMIGM